MPTTNTTKPAGLVIEVDTDVTFKPGGGPVPSDVQWLVDFDGDGDFDEPEEDITEYVMSGGYSYGRNQASQLHGETAPGTVRAALNNGGNFNGVGADRFSLFNTNSPLNTAPFKIREGMKIRVQTVGTPLTGVDPIRLAYDRFNGTGSVTVDELGNSWQANSGVVKSGGAMFSKNATVRPYINLGVDDAFIHAGWRAFNYNADMGILYRVDGSGNAGLVACEADGDILRFRHVKINSANTVTQTIRATSNMGEMASNRFISVHVHGSIVDVYLDGELVFSDAAAASLTGQGYGLYMDGVTSYRDWHEFTVWDSRPVQTEGVLWTGRCSLSMPKISMAGVKTVDLTGWGPLRDINTSDIQTLPSIGLELPWSHGMTTGQYAGNSLLTAGVPILDDIASTVVIGSVPNQQADGLAAARMAEKTEFGRIFETAEGYIGMASRSQVAGSGTVKSVWADNADLGGFHPESIEADDFRSEIRNRVVSSVGPRPARFNIIYGVGAQGTTGIDVNIQPDIFEACEAGWLLLTVVFYRQMDQTQWLLPAGWVEVRNDTKHSWDRFKIYGHIVTQDEIDDPPSPLQLHPGGSGAYIKNDLLISNFSGDLNDIKVVSSGYSNPGMSHLAARGTVQLPGYDMPWTTPSLHVMYLGAADANTTGVVLGSFEPLEAENAPYRAYNHSTATQAGTTNASQIVTAKTFRYTAYQRIPPSKFHWSLPGYDGIELVDIIVRGRTLDPNTDTAEEGTDSDKFLVTSEDRLSQDAIGAALAYEHTGLPFNTEADALEFNQLVLSRYTNPRASLKLMFTANKSRAQRMQAVRNRIGDRIYVNTTGKSGLFQAGVYTIESIQSSFDQGNKNWSVTWELSPV